MQTPAGVGGSEEDLPSLVIWHGRDPRLQSQQQVEERRDKAFSYLAIYRVAEQKWEQVEALKQLQAALAKPAS